MTAAAKYQYVCPPGDGYLHDITAERAAWRYAASCRFHIQGHVGKRFRWLNIRTRYAEFSCGCRGHLCIFILMNLRGHA